VITSAHPTNLLVGGLPGEHYLRHARAREYE